MRHVARGAVVSGRADAGEAIRVAGDTPDCHWIVAYMTRAPQVLISVYGGWTVRSTLCEPCIISAVSAHPAQVRAV